MPHVRVAVRCRPPLPHEMDKGRGKLEVNEIDKTVRVQTSKQGDKVFKFDTILPETARQEDLFNGCASPMIDHALDGLHATIFAYGQTGSGKTYSIEGLRYDSVGGEQKRSEVNGDPNFRPKVNIQNTPTNEHGVMLRCIESLFDRANMRMGNNPNIRYKIHCSYYQLYNERVTDLLNPASCTSKEGLKIRWSRNDQFTVQNLFIFECDDADQVRELVMMGVKNKTMGSHAMNLQSSRSHCIFTLYVTSWDPDNPDCTVKSQLTIVDLAGSEKLTQLSSNPSQQLVKESIEINTSLLSLGKVITALATNSKGHVPYRDAKLTKLLKHALGGNSMTLMLACISPLDSSIEETLSTLLYAGRARNITNEPRVNEDPRSALIRQLREEILALKTELEYYRNLALEGGADAFQKVSAPVPTAGGAGAGAGGLTPTVKSSNRPSTDPNTGTRTDLDGTTTVAPSTSTGANDSLLSEKLIASCAKLKEVIGLNVQLRKAFDKVSDLKNAAEKREVELNAENIALRERIEMLESIAMQEATAADESEKTPEKKERRVTSSQMDRDSRAARNASRGGDSAGYEFDDSDFEVRGPGAGGTKPSSKQQSVRQSAGGLPPRGGGDGSADDPYGGGYSFKEKLSQYNKKYHNPVQSANYEAYYGAAQKSVNSRASQQLNSDIDRLMKKIGNPQAKALVPDSLQQGGSFGSLSFGGGSEATDFEERRRQRELKRQQLQAKHMQMQQGAAPDADEMRQSMPTAAQMLSIKNEMPGGEGSTPPRLGTGGRPTSNSSSSQQQLQPMPARSASTGGGGLGRSSGGYAPMQASGSIPMGGSGRGASIGGGAGGTISSSYGRQSTTSSTAAGGINGGVSSSSTSGGGGFSYLSQEETKGLFTPEQLALLRSRAAQPVATSSSSTTISGGTTGSNGNAVSSSAGHFGNASVPPRGSSSQQYQQPAQLRPGSSGSVGRQQGYGPPSSSGAPPLSFSSGRLGGNTSVGASASSHSAVTQRLLDQMKNSNTTARRY